MKKRISTILGLFALVSLFFLGACELRRSIEGGITTTNNTVLVTLSSPSSNDTVSSNDIVSGSAYADNDLSAATLFAVTADGSATNTTSSVLSGQMAPVLIPLEMATAGDYLIYIVVSDTVGNSASSKILPITYEVSGEDPDTNAPTLSISSPTNNQEVGSSFTLTGSADDTGGSGLSEVYVSTDGANFGLATIGTLGSWSSNITLSGGGSTTLSAFALDGSGNSSITQSVIVTYTPGTPSVVISSPANGTFTNVSALDVYGTSSVDGASISSIAFNLNEGGWSTSGITGTTAWSSSVNFSEGTNTLSVSAAADNGLSNTANITVVVDSVAPSCSVSSPASGQRFTNVTSVDVSGTASDGSAVAAVYYSTDGSTFYTATGTTSWSTTLTVTPGNSYTLYSFATDVAGNVSGTNSTSFTVDSVDLVPPSISISTPTEGQNIPSGNVTLSGTASDNVALASIHYVLDDVTNSITAQENWSASVSGLSDGSYTITVIATDAAGNQNTDTVNFTYGSFITTATVYYKLPAAWPTPVYIHAWEYGGSGITTWATCPAMSSAGDGWYTYTIYNTNSASQLGVIFKDAAGNEDTYKTEDLIIDGSGEWWYWTNDVWYNSNPEDTSSPIVTLTSPQNGKVTAASSLSVTGVSAGSTTAVYCKVNSGSYSAATGVASWTYSASLDMGTNTLYYYATDGANYSATNSIQIIRINGSGDPYPGTYQGELGAYPYSDGVEFSVFWRDEVVSSVSVSIDGMGDYAMSEYSDNVWYVFVEGAMAGDEYTYKGSPVGGGATIEVADPYSFYNRYSSGNSVVVDHNSFAWTDSSWTRPGWDYYIIYELHIKDFTFEDSTVTETNKGKYLGVLEKLDYLTNLGITAIELLPISEFPDAGYSWGYNNSLFFAPESGYASDPLEGQQGVDQLKELINACHERGIAVIFDMVFNHTSSGDNWLWQMDSVAYFDYDLDGTVEAQAGGDDNTPWGNKFATTRDEPRQLAKDCLEYFMEYYHVDGFRFDATHSYYMDGTFLWQISEHIKGVDPSAFVVFENLPNESSKNYAAQWSDPYHDDGVNMFRGSSTATDITSEIYYSSDCSWWSPTSPFIVVNYVESHDEDTLGFHAFDSSYGVGYDSGTAAARSRLMAVMLSTSLGNPMIWMGQEFLRAREGQNIDEWPLDWSGLSTYGSLYDYYAGVLKLRRDNESLRDDQLSWAAASWGDGSSLPTSPSSMVAYSHTGTGADFVVALNFDRWSSQSSSVIFPEAGTWKQVVSEGTVYDYASAPTSITVSSAGEWHTITVGANSGVIYMKQ